VSANTCAEAHHLRDQALPVETIKILIDVHDVHDKKFWRPITAR